jgi:hypothetical protein
VENLWKTLENCGKPVEKDPRLSTRYKYPVEKTPKLSTDFPQVGNQLKGLRRKALLIVGQSISTISTGPTTTS